MTPWIESRSVANANTPAKITTGDKPANTRWRKPAHRSFRFRESRAVHHSANCPYDIHKKRISRRPPPLREVDSLNFAESDWDPSVLHDNGNQGSARFRTARFILDKVATWSSTVGRPNNDYSASVIKCCFDLRSPARCGKNIAIPPNI